MASMVVTWMDSAFLCTVSNPIVTRSGCWGFLLRLLLITETTLEYSLGLFILPRKPSLHVQAI